MTRRRNKVSLGGMAAGALAALVFLYLLFPILIVIPLSFSSGSYLSFPPPGFSLRWYENFLGRSDWLEATWLSVWIGSAVTALATALGVSHMELVRPIEQD